MIPPRIIALSSAMTIMLSLQVTAPLAQEAPTPSGQEQAAPEPLSEDELEVLVARIALYADELVALVSAASLFPCRSLRRNGFSRRARRTLT